MDRMTPEQRRRCMQAIRGKDTAPELRLRKALHAQGFRYVLRSKLPGHPDLVFPSKRVVLFVDGCFWHGCELHAKLPKTNEERWAAKLEKNILRDRRNNDVLKGLGWEVIRVWEHDIVRRLSATVQLVSEALRDRGRITRA